MIRYSEFLFSRPSFYEGAARVFDLANTMSRYNRVDSAQRADALAIAADWASVGDDIRDSILRARTELIESR